MAPPAPSPPPPAKVSVAAEAPEPAPAPPRQVVAEGADPPGHAVPATARSAVWLILVAADAARGAARTAHAGPAGAAARAGVAPARAAGAADRRVADEGKAVQEKLA